MTASLDDPVTTAGRVLQRVVLPPGLDLDVLSLYVEATEQASAGSSVGAGASPRTEQHPDHVLDRRRLLVAAGTRVSFATYFNAFPASYWRRWTSLDTVELRVRLSGPGTVVVYRSGITGNSERVETAAQSDRDGGEVVFRLPLTRFVEGGWYWFDVTAGRDDVVMESAEWRATPDGDDRRDAGQAGAITVGITTFNRPAYLVKLLQQLGNDPAVLDVLDEVLVVDQGTQKVRDQSGFDEASEALDGRVRVIEQANMGGSGGFARSMSETLSAGRSRYVLLIDDDVAAEPESILRALSFADSCRRPTIVGGHMFNLLAPSHLHSFGERVRPWRYSWGPAEHVEEDHDFRAKSLRSTPWMHRRIDVDYNAWWMCLIPVEVLKTVGLSLPFFIKWDDAEFGLRAGKAGFPTVSLPGMAIWHMPWTEKDDTTDWQAYFHQRNRLVTALLHSPYPRGGRVVRDSLYQQVRHLLAMQYSVADLRLRALQDVLDGPQGLHASLPTKLPEVRAVRASYPDSTTSPDLEAFPPVGAQPLTKDRQPTAPKGRLNNLVSTAVATLQQLRPVPPQAQEHPQAVVPSLDAKWWRLSQLDSALVTTADGAAVSWYRRDRTRFTELMRRSIHIHEQLLQQWPALSQRYRDAAPELVSPQAWSQTFRDHGTST